VKIALIVLAAGLSRRFQQQAGGQKLLADLDGKPVLQRTLEQAAASGLDRFVVIRPDASALKALCCGATLVMCDSGGLGESIAAGVRASRHYDGWLIALGDMPFVTPESYRAVGQALAEASIVRPWIDGRPGHPVGFQRHCYSLLSTLQGDAGPQATVSAAAVRLPLQDRGCLYDIDLPADLHLIKEFS